MNSPFAKAIQAIPPGGLAYIGQTPASIILPRDATFENGGVEGPSAVVNTWCGSPFDGERLWLHCGGHRASSDNGLYQLDLATGTWSVAFRPTDYTDTDEAGRPIPKGAPPAVHTYDGMVSVPGQIWRFKSGIGFSVGNDGYPAVGTWSFDTETGKWTKHPDPKLDEFSAVIATAAIGDGLVFLGSAYGGAGIYATTAEKLVWKGTLPIRPYADGGVAIWDAARSTVWLNIGKGLFAARIENGEVTGYKRYATLMSNRAGMALRDGRIYAWNGGSTVVRFDPDSGARTSIEIGAVSATNSKGVYSKWRYLSQYDVFVGLNWYDRPPMFWRPGGEMVGEGQPAAASVKTTSIQDPVKVADISGNAGEVKDPEQGLNTSANVAWSKDPYTFGGLPHYKDTGARATLSTGLDVSGGTGERPELGLVTEWVADYLATGRPEMRAVIIAHGDVDIAAHSWSAAHTPNSDWPAYLLTGDEKYIQQMRDMWQDYQVQYRQRSLTGPLNALQQREFAWQLRNLAEGAKVDPDYFKPALDETRRQLEKVMADCAAGNYHNRGALFYPVNESNCVLHSIGSYRGGATSDPPDSVTPWQQTFITQVLAHVVMLGNDDWKPILDWQFQFWKELAKRSEGHLDGSHIYYLKNGTYLGTWDAILAANGGPHGLVTDANPDGLGVGVHVIRGQQVLAAVAMAANAGVDGACDLYATLTQAMNARQARHRESRALRWNPIAQCS